MAELEKLLCTDSRVESIKKINAIIDNSGGGGLQMFDTILKDHVLTYEESKGLALQGTYVYKEALAGSRYGYPDFYAKCLEEYNETTSIETVNGVEVKVHSNGHKFYDIANKDAIDSFFNTMGSAWSYGIDTENERIFLPRNNYFIQLTGDVSEVGDSVEAGLPNITGTFGANTFATTSGAFTYSNDVRGNSGGNNNEQGTATFDASRSSAVYGKSNTVQPNAVKKLLYICVGNTTNYKGMTEVVNQGMEILEQVAQKVNVDGTNLTVEGKSLIAGLSMPSSKYIDLTVGANDSTYTAPADGWFFARNDVTGPAGITLTNVTKGYLMGNCVERSWGIPILLPCQKGDLVKMGCWNQMNIVTFRFYYLEGEQ